MHSVRKDRTADKDRKASVDDDLPENTSEHKAPRAKDRKADKDRKITDQDDSRENAPESEKSAKDKTDLRKQLYNGGKCGRIDKVQMPLEMITSLRGFLLDLDPALF